MLKGLKGVTNNSAIIVEDSSHPLMSMDISYVKKINKETSALSSILEKIDLTNTYRTFCPKAAEYTFFSIVRGTFSKINHMVWSQNKS